MQNQQWLSIIYGLPWPKDCDIGRRIDCPAEDAGRIWAESSDSLARVKSGLNPTQSEIRRRYSHPVSQKLSLAVDSSLTQDMTAS
jgi:hypothetical protein